MNGCSEEGRTSPNGGNQTVLYKRGFEAGWHKLDLDPRRGTGTPNPGSHRSSESGALAKSYQTVKEPQATPLARCGLSCSYFGPGRHWHPCLVTCHPTCLAGWPGALGHTGVPLRMSFCLGGSPAASDTSAFPATVSRRSVHWRRGRGGGGISPGQAWTHAGASTPEFQGRMDPPLPTLPSAWRCCGCFPLEHSNNPLWSSPAPPPVPRCPRGSPAFQTFPQGDAPHAT